eukprot:Rhum_TRINITY_DN14516_c7_g1::Rhum_TRINITY_DN14516_c7_g1_i1::g.94485::m.94485
MFSDCSSSAFIFRSAIVFTMSFMSAASTRSVPDNDAAPGDFDAGRLLLSPPPPPAPPPLGVLALASPDAPSFFSFSGSSEAFFAFSAAVDAAFGVDAVVALVVAVAAAAAAAATPGEAPALVARQGQWLAQELVVGPAVRSAGRLVGGGGEGRGRRGGHEGGGGCAVAVRGAGRERVLIGVGRCGALACDVVAHVQPGGVAAAQEVADEGGDAAGQRQAAVSAVAQVGPQGVLVDEEDDNVDHSLCHDEQRGAHGDLACKRSRPVVGVVHVVGHHHEGERGDLSGEDQSERGIVEVRKVRTPRQQHQEARHHYGLHRRRLDPAQSPRLRRPGAEPADEHRSEDLEQHVELVAVLVRVVPQVRQLEPRRVFGHPRHPFFGAPEHRTQHTGRSAVLAAVDVDAQRVHAAVPRKVERKRDDAAHKQDEVHKRHRPEDRRRVQQGARGRHRRARQQVHRGHYHPSETGTCEQVLGVRSDGALADDALRG